MKTQTVERKNGLSIALVHVIIGILGEKQLAHRNWLKLGRLASFRDSRMPKDFSVYSWFRTAATNPNHDSREVINSSLRIRQSYTACDCFVAEPSWSEYMFMKTKRLQVTGAKNNLPRTIREPRFIREAKALCSSKHQRRGCPASRLRYQGLVIE